jgi:hypothetical protein
MFIKSCYVLIFALAVANSVIADCTNVIPRTTPDQAFTIHEDGTVTHNTTGLMWMRCLLGQTWNGSTCSDKAQGYTWIHALQTAEAFSFAGYNDWRLPNKNELASIVERACYSPSINGNVFPNANISFVWSSSPYVDHKNQSWSVSFSDGHVNRGYRTAGNRVHLVRGEQ